MAPQDNPEQKQEHQRGAKGQTPSGGEPRGALSTPSPLTTHNSTQQTTEGCHVNVVQGRNDAGSMGTPGQHQQTPQNDPTRAPLEQQGMPEPRRAVRVPSAQHQPAGTRYGDQQDHPHVSASSTGDPEATSNARAMQSSMGTPGATPASTTAATSVPQTPDA
ncbi:hypothetical protein DXG01_004109 [Tephrocybe rancida]|nr:hypothetical protein DXG01_004109 [Tephrocybe rancida]